MPTVYYSIGSIDKEKAAVLLHDSPSLRKASANFYKLAVSLEVVLISLNHLLNNETHTNFEV